MAVRGSRGGREVDGALIAALVRGATRADAAVIVGVSPRTVYRRLQDEEFCARLRQAHQDVIDGVTARLSFLAGVAVETLSHLLEQGQGTAQLGAAKAVLDHALKWRDANEIEARVSALEAMAASGDP